MGKIKNHLTVEGTRRIKEMREKGMTYKEIAGVIGAPAYSVRLRVTGLHPLPKIRHYTSEEKESLIVDYNNGMSVTQLAKKYNRSHTRIRQVLTSAGCFYDARYKYCKPKMKVV